ncbi:hypothetical protein [Lichenibacterium ramalinae]|uniref:hypothetical protein n=1 Tax=Lichenibacterium ramalinae TaxID=2316527 RepID=UPI00100FC786|nr:hypothetical protein [Lichenibacterium ramalinae]
MVVSLARFDALIAESERRILDQAYRVIAMDLDGKDHTAARRALKAYEGILAEFRYARRLVAETQWLSDGARPKG